ncbi:hypothetical protein NIES22_47690 [Calothrix brevissima NIES-22]|nr:hypothetical protein NIES22_47690 [Calothrix brevissima NIES-22]
MSANNRNSVVIQLLLALTGLGIIILIYWWFNGRINTSGNSGNTITNSTPTDTSTPTPTSTPAENNPSISAGGRQFFNNEPPESKIYDNNAEIAQQNRKSHTIAVIVPTSVTNNKNEGLEILRGVALAQNEFNQNHLTSNLGLRVLIAKEIVGDNVGDNNNAQTIAEALVNDQKVLGVVGHFSTDATKVAIKVYNNRSLQDKLVAISPTSTGIGIGNGSGYFFRTVPNDMVAARALADYMLNTLGNGNRISRRKVAIFFDGDSDYSKSLRGKFESFIREGGGEIYNNSSNDQSYNVSKDNFDAPKALKDAINDGIQVFMFAFGSNKRHLANIILSPPEAQQPYFLAGDSIYSSNFLANAGAKARNMVFAVPWHRSITNMPKSTEFITASDTLWGQSSNTDEKMTWRTATAYDATKALIQAIEKSGNNTNRQRIQQVLSQNFPIAGVTREIKFDNNGDIQGGTKIVIACEISPNQPLEFRLDKCP